MSTVLEIIEEQPKIDLSFRDGIYLISLLNCLTTNKINLETIENWNLNCWSKSADNNSFRLGELTEDHLINLHNLLSTNIERINAENLEFKPIEDFHDKKYLNFSWLSFTLQKLGKICNFNITLPTVYNVEDIIAKYQTPFIQNINELYDKTYPTRKDWVDNAPSQENKDEYKRYITSRDIRAFSKYKLDYQLDPKTNLPCIDMDKYSLIRNDIISLTTNLFKKLPKNTEDFYVFRSLRENYAYNPEEKIMTLLEGGEVIEKNLTLISASYKLEFPLLDWSKKNYCCVYIIKVKKDDPYLIIHDQDQFEISLGAGNIILNNIGIIEYSDFSSFIMFGEFHPYSTYTEVVNAAKNSYCPE